MNVRVVRKQLEFLTGKYIDVHWTEVFWIIRDKTYDFADQRNIYGEQIEVKINKKEVKNERDLITIFKRKMRGEKNELLCKQTNKG